MNLDKLRPKIKTALNGNALGLHERVILSTLLYNNTFETAFKLRLGINQVEKVIKQFTTKLQGANHANN